MREEEKWKLMPIKNFWTQNKTSWWIISIALLLAYGIKVFNVSISHDTEAIMACADNLYGSWYSLGRFGLIFLKKVLGTYVFNPYAASFLMVVTMFADSVVWTYLFAWISHQNKKNVCNNWVFPVVFFTSLIVAEQSGFLLQVYEVNVALFFLAIALLNIFKGFLENRRWFYFLPAVIISVLAFATYQSFVPLFAAGAAVGFMLLYDSVVKDCPDMITIKWCWTLIARLIEIFLVSLVLYMGINKVVLKMVGMQTAPYLTDQIMWGKVSVAKALGNIAHHIYNVVLGKGIFYSVSFTIVCFAMVVYLLCRLKKKLPCYGMYVLATVFCLFSPFLMTVLTASEPSERTLLLLPFVTGVFLELLLNAVIIQEQQVFKWLYIVGMISTVMFSVHQSMLSARLFYTQSVQYEEDVRVATKISDRIDQLDLGESPTQPVAFVGSREPQLNAVVIPSDELSLIGKSFFELSFGTMHGTWVMNHFMDTLGYSYVMPSNDQAIQAEKYAENMPLWPNNGSVALQDGIIIVRLG